MTLARVVQLEELCDSKVASRPWEVYPYKLISWWNMNKFSAQRFFDIAEKLQFLVDYQMNDPINEGTANILADWLSGVMKDCDLIGLRLSSKYAERIMGNVKDRSITTREKFQHELPELQHRIQDEMEENLFMFIPSDRAKLYNNRELFGTVVNGKFPGIQFDIAECGNCYATGRGTAAVFHLMRIMEVGVQELGNNLGVPLVNEKVWQGILDGVNAKIKTLPPKDPKTVELAQASANLYAVKLAWRNEVMHPKDTYTLEEADNLIRQVRIFMEQLGKVV